MGIEVIQDFANPRSRFISERPSDPPGHPHDNSAKIAYLVKTDVLRNYCTRPKKSRAVCFCMPPLPDEPQKS